jgi:hypothetical protein
MGIFLQGGANLRPGGILGYRGGLNEIEGLEVGSTVKKISHLKRSSRRIFHRKGS